MKEIVLILIILYALMIGLLIYSYITAPEGEENENGFVKKQNKK